MLGCLVNRFLLSDSPVVGTPKCQADAEETDAAEAVEDFHAEVTDYMAQLGTAAPCFCVDSCMSFSEQNYVMPVSLTLPFILSLCLSMYKYNQVHK